MSRYRIFVTAVAGVSALILVLTQVIGGAPEPEVAAPELEPIDLPTVAPSPAPTATPASPAPTESPASSGEVIYEHDFSSPENGLLGGQSSDTGTNIYGTRYASYTDDGTLRVVAESELDDYVGGANTEELVVDGRPLNDLADVSIEVDATPVDLGNGANWGLACRRERESGRFYFAFIGDAGGHSGAGIVRQDTQGGAWTEVASARSLPEGVTIASGQTNRLRLDCLGPSITLYADGRKVVEGTDPSFRSGGLALFVNPLATSSAVDFDNLVIREA
jgi:hypothetical protein